jgi:molecular chaperone GrpE
MSGPEEELEKEVIEAETEAEADAAAGAADDMSDAKVDVEPPPPAEVLRQALEDAEKFRDVALRAEAEMQNVRRRAERDVQNAHKFGLERILTGILPVVDGMEKALEADDKADDPVIEGVRLTFKLLQDLLAKESVVVIDPAGEPFDPNEHEAMSMVENPDMEPNSVFAVIQKGYKLNERLVRPAMVMVTKAPADKNP